MRTTAATNFLTPTRMPFSSTIVDTLREFLARPENEGFLTDFKRAFRVAKSYDIPQFEEYGINTFEDYLDYLDTFLTWVPTENKDGKSVYYHICMFYFVLDQPPFSQYQTPIIPSGPWTWLSQWITDYARDVGKFMDSEESFSADALTR